MNTKRPPIGRPFCLAGYRTAILPFFTPPSTQRFPPVVFQRTSDGALEAASFDSKYVTPFSAPFGGFCLRLRSLCDGGVCGNSGVPFRGRRHARSQAYDAAAMAAGRHRLPPAPRVRVLKTRERRVTLSRHPVCRTDTPGFSGETTGRSDTPSFPLSPEGDHFPQALRVRAYVRPVPKAPTPPYCHAWQRILRRDGEIVGMDLMGGENGV